jgi:hypothetical protein
MRIKMKHRANALGGICHSMVDVLPLDRPKVAALFKFLVI